MMSFCKIRSEIQGKCHWTMNIGHNDLQIVGGHSQCQTEQVSKYDAFLFDTDRGSRKNHWTLKYRSQLPTIKVRLLTVSD